MPVNVPDYRWKTLPMKGSNSNTHKVIFLADSHETFQISEGFGVGGPFPLVPTCFQWWVGTNGIQYG